MTRSEILKENFHSRDIQDYADLFALTDRCWADKARQHFIETLKIKVREAHERLRLAQSAFHSSQLYKEIGPVLDTSLMYKGETKKAVLEERYKYIVAMEDVFGSHYPTSWIDEDERDQLIDEQIDKLQKIDSDPTFRYLQSCREIYKNSALNLLLYFEYNLLPEESHTKTDNGRPVEITRWKSRVAPTDVRSSYNRLKRKADALAGVDTESSDRVNIDAKRLRAIFDADALAHMLALELRYRYEVYDEVFADHECVFVSSSQFTMATSSIFEFEISVEGRAELDRLTSLCESVLRMSQAAKLRQIQKALEEKGRATHDPLMQGMRLREDNGEINPNKILFGAGDVYRQSLSRGKVT